MLLKVTNSFTNLSWKPRGHLYFMLDILIERLSKHTLRMYFAGMEIVPKYVFLHFFFRVLKNNVTFT